MRKKLRLSKTLIAAAQKNSSGMLAPFPINLSLPLHFTLYNEERFFYDTENTASAVVWNLKLENGIFKLSVSTMEGEFGQTYEAGFEGLYRIEEHLPVLSEAPVINYPTSHTSQGTVMQRLCLSIHSFESKRTPWNPDPKILQVEEFGTSEEFKPHHRVEDLSDKNYKLRLELLPPCDPIEARILGPYHQPEIPRPSDVNDLKDPLHQCNPNLPIELSVDQFTPEYIFVSGRYPDELCVPRLRRTRVAVHQGHVRSYGNIKVAPFPSLSRSLSSPDAHQRGPVRAEKPAPGLFLQWKMNNGQRRHLFEETGWDATNGRWRLKDDMWDSTRSAEYSEDLW